MNTARIVVLTIVPGAGGIAAYLASEPENKQVPADPATPLLGRPVIADANRVEDISHDQASKRGESVNVVRYGVAIQTTAQK